MTPTNIIRSGRWFLLVLVVVGAVALAGTVAAQATYPDPPTNVRVTATDTEATITWDAPADNGCPPTDYQVWVRDISTQDGERIDGNEVTSPWTATGLSPSTPYRVQVWTYSFGCDDYSRSAAEVDFETTAADANDAAEPAEKHPPKRVRNMRVTPTNVNSAVLRWQPGPNGSKHHAATEYLVVLLEFDAQGAKTEIDRRSGVTDTRVGISDIMVSGTKYRFRVAPYSEDCDCWGRWRGVTYTHS